MALAGRHSELAALRGALDRCARAIGGVVVLGGPVGCGRTELLLAFCEQARASGAVVLSATGSTMERDFPLSVLHQLMQGARLDPAAAEHVEQLLGEGALAAAAYSSRLTAPVVQGLSGAFLGLAERAPLVLAVDDAQDIDPQSLECLLFLARRIRSARVLIVLAERESTAAPHPLSTPELVRLPHYRRVALGLLAPGAVAELVAGRTAAANTRQLARDWHAVGGGNPLMINALIEDYQASAKDWSGCTTSGIVVGDVFRRGFVSCLYRLDPLVLRVARALAMLGEPASADLLARLLEVEADAADRAVAALQSAGFLERGRFRHPEARAEVIRDMDVAVRADLHRRAAYLLHGSDVEATRVARHIAAAGDIQAPWAAPILQAAAQQALDDGRTDSAVQWLRLAERASTDAKQRSAAKTALLQVEMRLDPAGVGRHVPWVLDALRDGHLDGRLGVSAAKFAFWHGRVDEAAAALGRMDLAADARLHDFLLWLSHWYPGVELPVAAKLFGSDAVDPAGEGRPDGLGVLVRYLHDHDADAAVEGALRVLRDCRLDVGANALESLTGALTSLLYADRADLAARWCEPLLERTTGECSPMWLALFTAIRGQTALRLGALRTAVQCARSAITQIPIEGWGVAAGIPLSVLVSAMVAMGSLEHAARYLAVPVPDAMFQTPAGVLYLHARGRYHLAAGRAEAALADFRSCGDFMLLHDIDLPAIAPWRTGAAEAYLLLGRPQQARALAQEQSALAGPRGERSGGLALRALAAASAPHERPALLEDAVELLQTSADQYELALALADLASAYHDIGESGDARAIERRAVHLKTLCRSESAPRESPSTMTAMTVPLPGPPEWSRVLLSMGTPQGEGSEAATDDLSDAERRVADLAARGLTNRQISAKLYVTVSTVEQHLTRIYRKLGVSRRVDLPTRLEPNLAGRRSA